MLSTSGKLLLAVSLSFTLARPALSQPRRPVIHVDPAQAGPDFQIQGEYEGLLDGKAKLAAQVIAEGNSNFAVVFLPGGLPGAGWDGKTRIRLKAATVDGKTTLAGAWSGTIDKGKLGGTSADGKPFTLERVIRKSPTLGVKPPRGAVALFDGSGADGWEATPRAGSFKGFLVDDREGKVLYQGSVSKKTFRDTHLHVEFRLPFAPEGRGQNRCNSGLYLQNRYELQVLDSFGLEGRYDDCGAIYGVKAPAVNMCLPPLVWQSYDIDFRAARYNTEGKKTANARLRVVHNGVLVLDDVEIKAPTTQAVFKEEDTPGPLYLQGTWGQHVHFRNIWLVEK